MASLKRAGQTHKKNDVEGKEKNPAINQVKVKLHFNELLQCFG